MARRRRPQHEPDPTERDLGPVADPEAVARTIVLTKLTAQARSRHELEEALAVKDVPADVVTSVLDRFEALGLVDDTAFAQAWVESRVNSRGLSRRALRHELRRKGVNNDVIAESLESLDSDQELAAARQLVERKLRSTRQLPADVRFRRLVGLLARKGYPAGLSVRVVRQSLADDSGVDAYRQQAEADMLDPL